jgi:hypothetical protein
LEVRLVPTIEVSVQTEEPGTNDPAPGQLPTITITLAWTASHDGGAARWAVVASLLATAKLNDVKPFAYLKNVLERMSNGHPMSRLDQLLPWNWTPSAAAA